MSDLRSALRQLTRAPGFTLIAVLALALGIGANTAIFSVVRGILLRPLPFPDAAQLAFIGEWSEQVPRMSMAYPNFIDFRDRQQSFSAFGAARSQGFNFIGGTEPVLVRGAMASAGLFEALGVPPLHGRLYSHQDDKPGAARTVLLRERFWRQHFAADPAVVGRSINLSGDLYTVVGVMPDDFRYPHLQTDLWVPLGLWADEYADRGNHPGLYALGRIAPEVTFDQARTDLRTIAEQLANEHPASNARQSITMVALPDQVFQQVRPALLILLGAAGCVLLIACANVANLQLARAVARSREFGVRAALGAGRGRVVRQLLVESVLLGLLGCVAGILVGWWSLEGLKSLLPANVPRVDEIALDGGVLLFALGASLVTSVVFGLVPAWHASRLDLRDVLAQGSRGAGHAGGRVRSALIVGEFALTAVLLIGAGLMLRTIANLYRADPGFATDQLMTFNWVLPGQEYAAADQRRPVVERALTRLEQLPGVRDAAIINPLPLTGGGNQSSYHVEGSPAPEAGQHPSTEVFDISPATFPALRIPLLLGRNFTAQDHAEAPKVAIVDTRFVEKNFGAGVNPVGRRFRFGAQPSSNSDEYVEIIGVVPNIANYGLGQETREQCYVPVAQSAPSFLTFLLRTEQDPATLAPAAQRAMAEVVPDVPVFGFQTMEDLFVQNISPQRLTVALLGTFALLALVLAGVGLYGVLSTSVGQRTREIGVRMALGATSAAVIALVVRHGLRMALLGLALGIGVALVASRVLQSVLYGVEAGDPLSFAAALLILLGIGLLACWLPARRASRVNPVEALRAE